MTAANVILHRDAAHLITDGAVFEDSRMRWQTTKAFPLPHLSAAVAVSGQVAHGPLIATALGMAANNFDALRWMAPGALHAAESLHAEVIRRMPDRRYAVVVAGIGLAGPEAFVISNDERFGKPYTVMDFGPVAMLPGDAETHAAFARAYAGRTTGDEFNPESDGLRMLELQRGQRAHGIGGFAQLTTVTAAGISTRILHRYGSTADLRNEDAA